MCSRYLQYFFFCRRELLRSDEFNDSYSSYVLLKRINSIDSIPLFSKKYLQNFVFTLESCTLNPCFKCETVIFQ